MLPLLIGSNLELSSHNCPQEEKQLKTHLFSKAPRSWFVMHLLCSLTIACLRVCVSVCVRARMFILECACFEEEGEVSL